MTIYEIRDPDEARHHLLSSLWLGRGAPLTAERVDATLAWAEEIVSEGSPLPPLGFVADVGYAVGGRRVEAAVVENPYELDSAVARRYEDYVLGKMAADMTFERGVDAVQQYSGRDRNRAIAYLANTVRQRCRFGGALLSSAVIKGLRELKGAEVLGQSQQVMEQAGWSEDLLEEWNDLIDAVRTTGDLLGPEDVFELESGTALAEFGQRVALRQVLQATALLEQGLPRQKPRGTPRRYSVATNIMDEDSYPVGGFTSISNRGTIESLLRSELAYMDDDDNRPDMFDIKYVRDELLYYARDENQFLRRRLSYFFLLHPELVKSRFKDSDCSWQRIIYVLALLVLAVRKLTDWLSDDAIHFELLFLRGQPGSAGLDDERSLLRTLLAEELSKGLVAIDEVGDEDVRSRLTFHARQSLCHVLSIGADKPLPSDLPVSSHLDLSESAPKLRLEEHLSDPGADHTGDDAWQRCAEVLMKFWI
ncbi:MAG: hypothetical protein KDB14_04160 [Planctomycetales bacterium]|nr:hypothetical protein [Planctomycetales bacterium]